MQGLAADGGLFMPDAWPQVDIEKIKTLDSFIDVAKCIVPLFTKSSFSDDEVLELLDDTWHDFSKENFATIHQLDDTKSILELFHGPTAAFKDFGLQLAAAFFNKSLLKQNKTAIVLGATSGDTGSAAIHAFRGKQDINVFILHPHNRVSDVQRRQMTTVQDDNIFNIAIKGNFDDCQKIVKELFIDDELQQHTSLTAINSINWARLMAQVVYYFWAYLQIDEQEINFIVPSGNFGNVFSANVAKKMGLPIDQLHITTNQNDILHSSISQGLMKKNVVTQTYSPSTVSYTHLTLPTKA